MTMVPVLECRSCCAEGSSLFWLIWEHRPCGAQWNFLMCLIRDFDHTRFHERPRGAHEAWGPVVPNEISWCVSYASRLRQSIVHLPSESDSHRAHHDIRNENPQWFCAPAQWHRYVTCRHTIRAAMSSHRSHPRCVKHQRYNWLTTYAIAQHRMRLLSDESTNSHQLPLYPT